MKNNLLGMILIFTLLALIAGATSSLLIGSHTNLNGHIFNLNRELNLNSYGYMPPSFIIQEPRKVVVNHDLKVEETISSLKSSLLGIYAKNDDQPYYLEKPLAQALAVTIDGWIMAAWPETNITDLNIEEYVAIDHDKDIYEIEDFQLMSGSVASFVFLKLENASNLKVRRLVEDSEVRLGQSLLLALEPSYFILDNLASKTPKSETFFSDSFPYDFVLNSGLRQGPYFIFNLAGDIVGSVDADGVWMSSSEINAYWRSLFKLKKLTRSSLGVEYLNLSSFVNSEWPDRGALLTSVSEFSPDEIEEGDIITKVNGIEINSNNNLSILLAGYDPGDRLFISYLREDQEKEIEFIIPELK